MHAEHSKKTLPQIYDPLELALKGPKYARVSVVELERWSEERQEKELLKG